VIILVKISEIGCIVDVLIRNLVEDELKAKLERLKSVMLYMLKFGIYIELEMSINARIYLISLWKETLLIDMISNNYKFKRNI
jgi:hypothetical protein